MIRKQKNGYTISNKHKISKNAINLGVTIAILTKVGCSNGSYGFNIAPGTWVI